MRSSSKRLYFSLALFILAVIPCYSQSSEAPALDGYVTRVVSPSDFDVNGVRVITNGPWHFYTESGSTKSGIAPNELVLYVGLPAKVYGRVQKKTHSISAIEVVLPASSSEAVSGSGVVEAVLTAPALSSSDHLLRADGRRVLISSSTALSFKPPLQPESAFRANVWLTFHGARRDDGVIVADKAELTENVISGGEEKLRSKSDYDPAAVNPNRPQSEVSKAFLGLDPKRIPPYPDTAMQARVAEIGEKLIPQYQRELPTTDPSKIHFRFQVVNNNKWHDAAALPDGVILVPRQVVERLENDAQLAAVLADNMAIVLEKQSYHLQPARRTMTAAQAAGDVGTIFVPGLNLATLAANSAVWSNLRRQRAQQSSRVALFLLQDAGYDIFQAPIAWWRLASSKNISDTRMPAHAAYVYKALGENWRQVPSPATVSAQPAAN